jgi:hypothetical protein
MTTKPPTVDAIALTEKKMDMTLGMFLLQNFSKYCCIFFPTLVSFEFFILSGLGSIDAISLKFLLGTPDRIISYAHEQCNNGRIHENMGLPMLTL